MLDPLTCLKESMLFPNIRTKKTDGRPPSDFLARRETLTNMTLSYLL